MVQTIVSLIIVSIMLIILTFIPLTISLPVDCSKFVFAPTCRGVIAKRINSFSVNPKTIQRGIFDRSEMWPDPSYKSLITKLAPLRFGKEASSFGWGKFEEAYPNSESTGFIGL